MGRQAVKYGLFLSLLLQSALVSADTLSDRLSGFATLDESGGSFVETWSADYLNESLVSRGELKYKRPGQLSKFISHPERIEQRIKGNQLSVVHNGETRSVQLSEQPELAAGIYALQAVLDGDEKKLHKLFELRYSETNTSWNLSLKPKDQQVASSLELIIVQGKGNRIQRVNIQFYNGDNLLTEIAHGR